MICKECGTVLPEVANFCFHCGVRVSDRIIELDNKKVEAGVELVLLKCINCGASIECNAKETQGVCVHCGAKFLIRDRLNNSTNSFQRSTSEKNSEKNLSTLVKRGQEFEQLGDTAKAIKYYNEALDIDYANKEARSGLARIKLEFAETQLRLRRCKEAQDIYLEIVNSEYKVLVDEAKERYDAINKILTIDQECFDLYKFEEAIEKYKTINGSPAIEDLVKYKIEQAEKAIEDFVYLSSMIDTGNIGGPMQLLLRKDGLYVKDKTTGSERKYSIKSISNVSAGINGLLMFDYCNFEFNFPVKQPTKFVKFINDLAKGEILDRAKTKIVKQNGVIEYIREN